MKVLPYSYSSLTSFETCPRKHYMTKVAKLVQLPPFKAAQDGIEAHKDAEDFVNHGTPMKGVYAPKIMETLEPLTVRGVKIYTELELAVTRDQKPCTWKAEDAHARAILDILQVDGKEAWSIDWKTGKPDPYSTQLKHSALLVFMHHPQVEVVHTEYKWLKAGYSTKAKIHREFLQENWNNFERRVIKLEKALETNNWPAKPSGLCKQYCPDTTCEHNGLYAKNQ